MCPSGRKINPTTVVVDEISKSFSCNIHEKPNKYLGDHLVTNDKIFNIPTKNNGHFKIIWQKKYPMAIYFKKEWRLLKKWWKNHILF